MSSTNAFAAASTPSSSSVATRSSSRPRADGEAEAHQRGVDRTALRRRRATPRRPPAASWRRAARPGRRARSTRRRGARTGAARACADRPTSPRSPPRGPPAVEAAGPVGGARPPRRSPAASPRVSRSGATAFGDWCRRRRRHREVSGHRCLAPRPPPRPRRAAVVAARGQEVGPSWCRSCSLLAFRPAASIAR